MHEVESQIVDMGSQLVARPEKMFLRKEETLQKYLRGQYEHTKQKFKDGIYWENKRITLDFRGDLSHGRFYNC